MMEPRVAAAMQKGLARWERAGFPDLEVGLSFLGDDLAGKLLIFSFFSCLFIVHSTGIPLFPDPLCDFILSGMFATLGRVCIRPFLHFVHCICISLSTMNYSLRISIIHSSAFSGEIYLISDLSVWTCSPLTMHAYL